MNEDSKSNRETPNIKGVIQNATPGKKNSQKKEIATITTNMTKSITNTNVKSKKTKITLISTHSKNPVATSRCGG